MQFYGVGGGPFANTPNLATFQNTSRRFDDAWSNPVCSPTRATLHTGRYGFRTGIGKVVVCDSTGQLDTSDPNLLPKRLKAQGYATAAFGKWHLGSEATLNTGCPGLDRPVAAGYDLFDGIILDDVQVPGTTDYFHYKRTRIRAAAPPAGCSIDFHGEYSGYMTDDFADSAAAWITQQTSTTPWFAYVAFVAAHAPYHCPPEDAMGPYGGHDFPCGSASDTVLVQYQSMIEAMDLDFQDLLDAVKVSDPTLANTLVLVLSDNGSPPEVTLGPFSPALAKGTVAQGGIWVPMMIGGYTVTPGGTRPAEMLVGAIDLYRTILTVAGIPDPFPTCSFPPDPTDPDDACDLGPYFTNPAADVRDYLYSEWFYPNFDPTTTAGPSMSQQAIRGPQFKLIRTEPTGGVSFYDLVTDPAGSTPIDPTGHPE